MAVVLMVDADEHGRARLAESRPLRQRQGEAEELNGGSLALGARVLSRRIGDAGNALASRAQKHMMFDAPEPRQRLVALPWIVDLEHHCGHELITLWNERIVGSKLVGDLCLAPALDMEHLVNLEPHRGEVLEIERAKRADFDTPMALQLADAPAV